MSAITPPPAEVFVHDDGKGAACSFEAWSSALEFRGYGSSEQEAKENHAALLHAKIAELYAVLGKIKGGAPATMVDCQGIKFPGI